MGLFPRFFSYAQEGNIFYPQNALFFLATIWNKACEEAGLSPKALLGHLKSKGLIDTRSKGYTKTKRIDGMAVDCVWLRLQVGAGGLGFNSGNAVLLVWSQFHVGSPFVELWDASFLCPANYTKTKRIDGMAVDCVWLRLPPDDGEGGNYDDELPL